MKPETKFRQNTVEPFLKTLRNTYHASIQQMSLNGTADKFLCIWGRFVALECKKSEKKADKPRPLQEYYLSEVKRTGGVRLTASPDNWDEIKTILSNMDASKEQAWKQV